MISGNTSEGIDRISSLPDEVIHNILSSLSIFDEVVQLSVLSKRWRYIWTTMPYLHFDIDQFWLQQPNSGRRIFYTPPKENFKDFINWVLISQRETKLAKFLLCVAPDDYFDKMEVLRWIHAATRRNVQEIVLEFTLCEPLELPICLATCESLQVLKLNLPDNILKLPNHFGFRQLKLLHLEDVQLSDKHSPNCFISKCHQLKSLILHECGLGAMTLLSIDSISLSSVTIIADYYQLDEYGKCKLKISCPNLKFLNYEAPIPKDIIIENLLSIEDVSIVVTIIQDTEIFVHKMIKEVSSTSALTLCNYSILGMYKATSKGSLSLVSFYKLKTLKLYARVDGDFMQAMILLLKYSPNLEVLQLWCLQYDGLSRNKNWQMHDLDESIVCLESHLKSIRLIDFKGEENEIKLLKFFLKNAPVLEKLTIFWVKYPDKSEEALEKVLKLPRTSSQVVLTFLDAKPQPSSRKWYDR
ncbi:hypothetical protein KY290_019523 [Solanum tuberosum]|uniref:F-box domain-containing protein n=1 Tax=Solanum tuberosum TaxID=4113 RepID=A0ABQ7VKB3_SOLTU|nr:hypothetical protein KY284_018418 [Solanum tuberosum]KAH0763450.1 hypothetical protein KY290_019523 [Solanum tuberosum]